MGSRSGCEAVIKVYVLLGSQFWRTVFRDNNQDAIGALIVFGR